LRSFIDSNKGLRDNVQKAIGRLNTSDEAEKWLGNKPYLNEIAKKLRSRIRRSNSKRSRQEADMRKIVEQFDQYLNDS